jgi:hypothetical protein
MSLLIETPTAPSQHKEHELDQEFELDIRVSPVTISIEASRASNSCTNCTCHTCSCTCNTCHYVGGRCLHQ